MRREMRAPRPNWRARCEEAGFSFHSMGGTYWDESVCYAFTADEIDRMEDIAAELHQLCLNAADEAVRARRFAEFAIPEPFHELVAQSWRSREPTLYGRFDFSWDGEGEPKLLEYNADTPTSLLEASVVQWHWLEDVKKDADQFNSLHEKLVARLQALRPAAGGGVLHLACANGNEEDLGWDGARFVDLEDAPVATLFKLYPWEWLVREEFGRHLLGRPAALFEPAWKMLLSNKALLVLLWEMNYGHPNLLPSYFTPQKFGADYVRKPLLSREGANVTIRSRGEVRHQQPGAYGQEGYVYQGVAPLPAFDNRYPVIGAWIVGDQPAGIGIREDDSPITRNSSRFVPHYFT